MINQVIGGQSVGHWIDHLNQAGVPCGRVMNMAEVFDDDQVVAQDMVLAVDHPGHGTVRMTGFPVKLSADPCTVRRPAPDLGAHTDEVLADLGYDPAKIAALRADDVI